MMRRIADSTVPSFLLLQYSNDWVVRSVSAIHHTLITPAVIEQRNPLALTAKRAGWIGCNILLSGIPPEGRIAVVSDGVALSKAGARKHFAVTEKLATLSLTDRGWASSLLRILHQMGVEEFAINDVYKFENQLASLYPNNKNVRPKIRQQLQVLRDKGFLQFLGMGKYRLAGRLEGQ
jgi:type II restriction enzyme